MKELATSHNVDIRWRSFELRPAGGPPIPPEYRAQIEAGRPQLYALAHERYGVEMNSGPFGIDSRPALVGAKYAEAEGKSAEYHAAVFRAYWLDARSIDDREVLGSIAESIGLERQAFQAALADASYAAEVTQDVDMAAAYGLSGVPAIVYEQRYLVSGAQPTQVLRQVAEQVLAQRE